MIDELVKFGIPMRCSTGRVVSLRRRLLYLEQRETRPRRLGIKYWVIVSQVEMISASFRIHVRIFDKHILQLLL